MCIQAINEREINHLIVGGLFAERGAEKNYSSILLYLTTLQVGYERGVMYGSKWRYIETEYIY